MSSKGRGGVRCSLLSRHRKEFLSFQIQVYMEYKDVVQQNEPKNYPVFKQQDLVFVHQPFLMRSLCSVFSVVKK